MSFQNSFNTFNQPYYGTNTIPSITNSSLNGYNFQNLNSYLNQPSIYRNFNFSNPSLENTDNSISNYFKNQAQNYLNAFYQIYYPQFANFIYKPKHSSKENIKIQNDQDSKPHTIKRTNSLENFYYNAKEAIKNRCRLHRSGSMGSFENNHLMDKLETSPYIVNKSYSNLDKENGNDEVLTTKNILLPEIIVNGIRYNRPAEILANLSKLRKNSDLDSISSDSSNEKINIVSNLSKKLTTSTENLLNKLKELK